MYTTTSDDSGDVYIDMFAGSTFSWHVSTQDGGGTAKLATSTQFPFGDDVAVTIVAVPKVTRNVEMLRSACSTNSYFHRAGNAYFTLSTASTNALVALHLTTCCLKCTCLSGGEDENSNRVNLSERLRFFLRFFVVFAGRTILYPRSRAVVACNTHAQHFCQRYRVGDGFTRIIRSADTCVGGR